MTPAWSIALAVFVGGALGGALRHLLSRAVARVTRTRWPWGTLMVNVSGAFFGGVVVAAGTLPARPLTAMLVAGVLGGYTTVSTVALQVAQLSDDGQVRQAMGYLLATLGLGLAAALLGFGLGGA